MNHSFKDKVCLVTGASGDIGKEIACKLKASGGTVIGWGGSKLPGVELDLEQQVDVANEQSVEKAISEIDRRFSRVDILVTAAGISESKLSARLPEKEWSRMIQVNLTGSWLCARSVSKFMMAQKCGSILFISSLAAHRPHAGQSAYAASKGGIESLTRALAVELAPKNIRVNAISPGFVEGSMTRQMAEDIRNKTKALIPLARFAAPSEIASAALFLVSDEAGYMTAQILDVSGGLGM